MLACVGKCIDEKMAKFGGIVLGIGGDNSGGGVGSFYEGALVAASLATPRTRPCTPTSSPLGTTLSLVQVRQILMVEPERS